MSRVSDMYSLYCIECAWGKKRRGTLMDWFLCCVTCRAVLCCAVTWRSKVNSNASNKLCYECDIAITIIIFSANPIRKIIMMNKCVCISRNVTQWWQIVFYCNKSLNAIQMKNRWWAFTFQRINEMNVWFRSLFFFDIHKNM